MSFMSHTLSDIAETAESRRFIQRIDSAWETRARSTHPRGSPRATRATGTARRPPEGSPGGERVTGREEARREIVARWMREGVERMSGQIRIEST